MKQGTRSELHGGPRRSPDQRSADLVRKAVGRPPALADLKRLIECGLGSDDADPFPVIGPLDVAVPTLLKILRVESLRTEGLRIWDQALRREESA